MEILHNLMAWLQNLVGPLPVKELVVGGFVFIVIVALASSIGGER